MAAQLAQFSSLEQLTNLGSKIGPTQATSQAARSSSAQRQRRAWRPSGTTCSPSDDQVELNGRPGARR